MGKSIYLKAVLYGSVAVFSYVFIKQTVVYINKDECAIIFDSLKGVKDRIIGEGFHFVVPFIQTPIVFKVSPSLMTLSHTVPTADSQNIAFHFDITYRPNIEELPKLFREIGPNYDRMILPSVSKELARLTLANHSAEDFLARKDEIQIEMVPKLIQRVRFFNIIVDDAKIQIELSNGD